MAVSFRKPAGASVGVPGGGSAAQAPENILIKGLRSADRIERDKVKEADKVIKQKENEVKLRYYQSSLNGIDDPSELMDFYAKQAVYYEQTDRGDKAALSEQRGFLALERWQSKLEREARRGEGTGTSKGLAIEGATTDEFLTQYDAINTLLDGLGTAKESGAVSPREYGATLEQIMKEKVKLVKDYVRDPDDRNKLLGNSNLFTTKAINFGPKGGLVMEEEDPLGLDQQLSYKNDFEDWKDFRNTKEDMVWVQEVDERGVGKFKPATRRAVETGDKMYLTHERYSKYTQEDPENPGNFNMVEGASEAGEYYYEPFIARDDQGNVQGLGIYDYEAGDLDVIPFSDQMQELADMMNRGEVTDKAAMTMIQNPQGAAALNLGLFKEGVFTNNLIEDDSLAENWTNGGRWMGEPENAFAPRMRKVQDDILSGEMGRLSIDNEGRIKMNARLPHEAAEQAASLQAVNKRQRETVTNSKFFSDEAAQKEARRTAQDTLARNPGIFGSREEEQQFVDSQASGAKALFGFLNPVLQEKVLGAATNIRSQLPDLPAPARRAADILGGARQQGRDIKARAQATRQQRGAGSAFLGAARQVGRESFQNILNAFRRR